MPTTHHHHNHLPEESCNAECFAEVESNSSDREHRFFAALTRIKHHAELLSGPSADMAAFAASLPPFITAVLDGQNPHEVPLG